jgi:hypothetical protein
MSQTLDRMSTLDAGSVAVFFAAGIGRGLARLA